MADEKALAELQKYLRDEDYCKVLGFCLEPRSWNDIRQLNKGAKIKESKLFQIMRDLKLVGALEFRDGKYYTSDLARNVMK
jgi:hypothetical protein